MDNDLRQRHTLLHQIDSTQWPASNRQDSVACVILCRATAFTSSGQIAESCLFDAVGYVLVVPVVP